MKKPFRMKMVGRKLTWTLSILFIYMLGSTIPLPFVRMTTMYRNMLVKSPISIMSFLSGANFQRLSLFSVGLNPLMIAMMVVQLFSLTRMFWTDTLSMHQTMVMQQWLMLTLALIQSIAITLTFNLTATAWQAAAVIVILTAGSMFVVWLGFMNMQYGIGGTMTLVLFNLILGSMQPLLGSIHKLQTLPNFGWIMLALVGVGIVEILFWVAFNQAYYRMDLIDVSLRSSIKPLTMPIALNLGGMMTYMMGMALLTLPMILVQMTHWRLSIINWKFETTFSMVMTFLLFYFFSFIQLNPKEQAKQMRNKNSYILNVRPGKPTQRYIRKRLLLVCLPGAILNACQLTLGIVGSQFLGKYVAFALVPLDIVMVVMFMKSIKDQLMVLLIPHRYERLMAKEG